MNKIKSVLFSSLLAVSAVGAIVYTTSCAKDRCKNVTCQNGGTCSGGNCTCPSGYTGNFCEVKGTSTVYFNNHTFTPITIVINGEEHHIDTGFHYTVNGSYKDSLKGNAYTKGEFGLTYNWDDIKFEFPKTGFVNYDLDIDSTYFFLIVTNNNDTAVIRKIYVNEGNPNTTLDFTHIDPYNKGLIGYYKASDTANVRVTSTPDQWTFPSLGLPKTKNQFYNAIVN